MNYFIHASQTWKVSIRDPVTNYMRKLSQLNISKYKSVKEIKSEWLNIAAEQELSIPELALSLILPAEQKKSILSMSPSVLLEFEFCHAYYAVVVDAVIILDIFKRSLLEFVNAFFYLLVA